jgi:hypothetical protein
MNLKGRPETGKMNILGSMVSGLRHLVQVFRFRRQIRDLYPNLTPEPDTRRPRPET